MSDIVELLTERRKLRYAGDCKCGKCCLVPHEMLCSAIDEIKRLRASPASESIKREALEEATEVAQARHVHWHMREVLEALLEDMPTPCCEHLHHPFKDQHTYDEECPVVERLDAAITKANVMLAAKTVPGWQLIESAPTDRLILVYCPSYQGLNAIVCCCQWDEDAGFCVDELRSPSHWMPLPAPPANFGKDKP